MMPEFPAVRQGCAIHGIPARRCQAALLILDGYTRRETAAAMGISPETVKEYMAITYIQLGVRSSVQMLRVLMGGTAMHGKPVYGRETHG